MELRFDRDDDAVWPLLIRVGRPVQFSYLRGPLSLWHVQTPAPGESHFELLQAFAPRALRSCAVDHARAAGYLGHEFSDASLVLAGC